MTHQDQILLKLLKGCKQARELRGKTGSYLSRLRKEGLVQRLKVKSIRSPFFFLTLEGWVKASKLFNNMSRWKKIFWVITNR